MKNQLLIFTLAISCGFASCGGDPDILDSMLDGEIIYDMSLFNPEDYLVSAAYPNPTPDDLDKHIIIAVHGYSASTFEWDEFRTWSDTSNNTDYRISQVLLGGHGRTYADFKNSTWHDWKSEVAKEYEKLETLGYKKISIVASSTGPTLVLEMISSGYFNNHISPKNIFLIDPIVVPSVKLQSIAGIVGPMLGYVEVENTEEEDKYWYHFRPQETVQELNTLMKKVRKDLENGYSLPKGTYLKAFHSKHDDVANSASTVLIYKGLTKSDGAKIDVQIMDSEIHVFTRLALRDNVSNLQQANQETAFEQIAAKAK